jgi:predicted RNA binding protein YcfA (HicA-like mRNA interferase family)
MSRLPIIDSKRFEKILLKLGFIIVRQKGSHVFYKHTDGRYTTLPHHPGRDLGRSLTRRILKEINLSPEDFTDIIKKL